jgi:hypothetical protein
LSIGVKKGEIINEKSFMTEIDINFNDGENSEPENISKIK